MSEERWEKRHPILKRVTITCDLCGCKARSSRPRRKKVRDKISQFVFCCREHQQKHYRARKRIAHMAALSGKTYPCAVPDCPNGIPFSLGRGRRRRYCSDDCKRVGAPRQPTSAAPAPQRERAGGTHPCDECGEPKAHPPRNPGGLAFCSTAHQRSHWERRRRVKRAGQLRPVKCGRRDCPNTFTPSMGPGHPRRYCSDECRRSAPKRAPAKAVQAAQAELEQAEDLVKEQGQVTLGLRRHEHGREVARALRSLGGARRCVQEAQSTLANAQRELDEAIAAREQAEQKHAEMPTWLEQERDAILRERADKRQEHKWRCEQAKEAAKRQAKHARGPGSWKDYYREPRPLPPQDKPWEKIAHEYTLQSGVDVGVAKETESRALAARDAAREAVPRAEAAVPRAEAWVKTAREDLAALDDVDPETLADSDALAARDGAREAVAEAISARQLKAQEARAYRARKKQHPAGASAHIAPAQPVQAPAHEATDLVGQLQAALHQHQKAVRASVDRDPRIQDVLGNYLSWLNSLEG